MVKGREGRSRLKEQQVQRSQDVTDWEVRDGWRWREKREGGGREGSRS